MKDFAVKTGLAATAYFSPLYEIFVVMMVFVAADLVSGVIASHNRGVPRSSRRLRKSIVKLVCYLSAMMLAFSAEQAFHVEWFVAHRAIGAFICGVEFVSILENFAVITGRPVFLKIISWIRGKSPDSQSLINEIINEKNDLFNPSGRPDGIVSNPSDNNRREPTDTDR